MSRKPNNSRYRRNRRKRDKDRLRKIVAVVVIIVLLILVVNTYRALAHKEEKLTPFPKTEALYGVSIDDLCKVVLPDSIDSEMVNYSAMSLSFNKSLHIPNYVVWELTGDETNGDFPRNNAFATDWDVEGCPTLDDYRNSGYDRGHMMPAADARFSQEAMTESFYLTNMCPQAGALNHGSWKTLEEKCRIWAQADSAIIIICGPVVTDRITEHIGFSEVAVPDLFFKVILSPFANPPRAIGFVMPNGKVHGGIQAAAVSVNDVEKITGYDFFSALPDELEEEIESQCKFNYWTRIKP